MPYSFKDEDSTRASSEFLIGDESRPPKVRRQRWSMIKVGVVSVVILVGILEMIVLESILLRFGAESKCPPALLSELNSVVPNFSIKPVLFRKDPSATINHDHDPEQARNETRDDWLSYMPRGNGFIAVNHSDRYKLPEPIHFQGQDTYSMAVFHQMHCLYAIMDRYNDLTSGRAQGHEDHHKGHGNHRQRDSSEHNHVDHCFRYLRQSILCCGDTALEGQDPNTNTTGTDGTGAVHMCKDFEAIRSWAEDNRLVNAKHE